MVTVYEYVGEAGIEQSSVAFISSLNVLDASYQSGISVDIYLHLLVLDDSGLHVARGEHLKILRSRGLRAVRGADREFLCIKALKERDIAFFTGFGPIMLKFYKCLFVSVTGLRVRRKSGRESETQS
jgi:hypothetical protein